MLNIALPGFIRVSAMVGVVYYLDIALARIHPCKTLSIPPTTIIVPVYDNMGSLLSKRISWHKINEQALIRELINTTSSTIALDDLL